MWEVRRHAVGPKSPSREVPTVIGVSVSVSLTIMEPTYQERKAERTRRYLSRIAKKITCTACNGSGRYDVKNSPPCSACNGTGKISNPSY
jgi:DnaJ-class molecular chaperone